MIPIDELKRQHADICELMNVLSILIPREEVRSSGVVQDLFSSLAGKVKEHIALEESSLYKELLVHEDEDLQRVARNFLSGSHGLKLFFNDYIRRSCKRSSKNEDCAAFVRETEEIFGTLKKRIEVEENKFYPLVENSERRVSTNLQ